MFELRNENFQTKFSLFKLNLKFVFSFVDEILLVFLCFHLLSVYGTQLMERISLHRFVIRKTNRRKRNQIKIQINVCLYVFTSEKTSFRDR